MNLYRNQILLLIIKEILYTNLSLFSVINIFISVIEIFLRYIFLLIFSGFLFQPILALTLFICKRIVSLRTKGIDRVRSEKCVVRSGGRGAS